LAFAGIFVILSVALINNTIRLAIYSQRFLIKSMQLVGATKGFIRKPFLLYGIWHGFWGLNRYCPVDRYAVPGLPTDPDLVFLQSYSEFGMVFLGVVGYWVYLYRPSAHSWRLTNFYV
jgi:cell division transport system permease protein